MNKADVTIQGGDWVALSSAISTAISDTFTFDSDKKYYFQVKSDVPVTFNNSAAEPTDDSGIVLSYGDQLVAKVPSGDMYVKAHGNQATINICEGEE